MPECISIGIVRYLIFFNQDVSIDQYFNVLNINSAVLFDIIIPQRCHN